MAAVQSHHLLFFFFSFFIIILLTLPSLSYSTDADALLKLKQSFTNASALSSWTAQSPSPCRWAGVMCDNRTIIGLHLADMGLSGKVDIDAMSQIAGLRTISLVNNSFSGAIPEFNKLGALKALYLSNNQFSGVIPSNYFSYLNSLKKIWLSDNKFSGPIPDSLSDIDLLIEVHLENNEFSGKIPQIDQEIKSLDLSNNRLEGAIPESLAKFGASAFKGNDGLCGKPLDKVCDNVDGSKKSSHAMLITFIILCIIIGALLLVTVRSRRHHSMDGDFSVLHRDHMMDETLQVHVPSSPDRESESSRRGGMGSRRVPAGKNGRDDQLVMVNNERGEFGLQDLLKANAEMLGNGVLGSSFKAITGNGLTVAVKKTRAINQIGRDAFDAEMRDWGRFRHANILTILAYNFQRDAKLIVTEFMPKGSLFYVLHGGKGRSHADLTWRVRLKIIKGIAQGLRFLHSHFSSNELPHGNLKSSNVLLTSDYEPLLTDYALHSLVNPNLFHALFAYQTPDFQQYQLISQKVDVYCLGIIILEVITGKVPSQYDVNIKGSINVVEWVLEAISERREVEVIDPEIVDTPNALHQMLKMVQIGAACTEHNPEQRINMSEAIRRIEDVRA